MEEVLRTTRRHVQRARDVERSVRLIVGGGVALVAGLWIATLTGVSSLPWWLGSVLVLLGVGGLLGGIWSELEY